MKTLAPNGEPASKFSLKVQNENEMESNKKMAQRKKDTFE